MKELAHVEIDHPRGSDSGGAGRKHKHGLLLAGTAAIH
jgi:hypothetical protein